MSPDRYTATWNRQRRAERGLLLAAAAPFLWLSTLILTRLLKPWIYSWPIVLVVSMLAFIWFGFRASALRCPRCGQDFFKRPTSWGYVHNGFRRHCGNCGLRKWSRPSAPDAPAG